MAVKWEMDEYGIMHPGWDEPSCYYYSTPGEAWSAIDKTYVAKGSTGHFVVRRRVEKVERPT